MGEVIGAGGLSHAIAFLPPAEWEAFREAARGRMQKRYGYLPELRPEVQTEDDTDNARRYQRVAQGRTELARKILAADASVLVIVGDDQNELFRDVHPPVAVFTGDSLTLDGGREVTCDAQLARSFVTGGVEHAIEVAPVVTLPDGRLPHAHAGVLEELVPGWTGDVVLVFVDAIHSCAPTPARCVQIGKLLQECISRQEGRRAVVLGSGGLSHFPASFPWRDYQGSARFGDIAESFDRKVVALLEQGDQDGLQRLTGEELLEHGSGEDRAWLVAAGATQGRQWDVTYEPFAKAMMGMGVGVCF
jgi:protocatechuate 4,5-dioxygenase beta chain